MRPPRRRPSMSHRLVPTPRAAVLAAVACVGTVAACLGASVAGLTDGAAIGGGGTAGSAAAPASIHAAARPRRPRLRALPPSEPVAVPASAFAEQTDSPAERRVRVVDLDGAPVEGVCVRVESADPSECTTAPDGTATFSFADGIAAGASPVAKIHDGWDERDVALAQPTTDVVVAFPVLDVEVVDATTGRAVVPVRVTVTTWHRARRTERVIEGAEFAGPAARPVHLPLAWHHQGGLRFTVVSPPGFGAAGNLVWEGEVAPQARSARFTIPVYPETSVELRAEDPEGRPVEGVALSAVGLWCTAGSESRGWGDVTHAWSPDGSATVVVRGLPALPVNAVAFVLAREPDTDGTNGWKGRSESVRLTAARAAPILVPMVPWDGMSERGGRCGGGGIGDACGGGSSTTTPVTVRVLRRDGTPAAHVEVTIGYASGTTGADGVAQLGLRRTGRVVAVATAHGFLPAAGPFVVGADTEITLREPAPRSVRVTVTDEAGACVPGASVRATCLRIPGPDGADVPAQTTVAQLVGDTELLAPRTDPSGCVTLALPEGTIRYAVTLAGAAVSVESSDDDVHVVLRAPK